MSTLVAPELIAQQRRDFKAIKILRFYNSLKYSKTLFTLLFLLNYPGHVIHTEMTSLKYNEHPILFNALLVNLCPDFSPTETVI